MPSIDILIAFATATAIFAYMPGPAMLYTAAQTIARGRSAGFFAAFGIHIGCYGSSPESAVNWVCKIAF
jgi:threonine/homoserine/homoserine lactone efflux protein